MSRNLGRNRNTNRNRKYMPLPKECIFDTFFNEKDVIKGEIFLDSAKKASESIHQSNMKKTSVRNFLRYLKGIEIPLRLPSGPKFEAVKPKLDELYSFVVYQTNRDKPPYSPVFRQLYSSHLGVIKRNEKEFVAFVKYISAIIAYLTELENNKKYHN